MCGRFALAVPKARIEDFYHIEIPFDIPLRFNITPSNDTLVLCSQEKLPQMMRWGFLPFWTKESSMKEQINSKCETVHEKPMFRKAFKEHRCIVVASGFFEWIEQTQQEKKVKTPFYFFNRFAEPISFAGIWDRNEVTQRVGFTILTTHASEHVTRYHERMPVILEGEAQIKTWLDPDSALMDLQKLFIPRDDSLSIREVSRRVNSPKNDDPHCIAAV